MRNLHIQFVYINFAAVFGLLCSILLIEILKTVTNNPAILINNINYEENLLKASISN